MSDKHTPTPWMLDKGSLEIIGAHGETVVYGLNSTPADSEFILRAVNAHEELLAALKLAAEVLRLKESSIARHCAQVIAKAEGK